MMSQSAKSLQPDLWEELIGGLAGEKLRHIFSLYRQGKIENAYREFNSLKDSSPSDIDLVEKSFVGYFGYPHPELSVLKQYSNSFNPTSQLPELIPTTGIMIRHHLTLLDHRPVSVPALYVFSGQPGNPARLKLTFPHPVTMVLSVLLLCLIAGTGGSVLSVYNTKAHPSDKVAGAAFIPEPTPLPQLTENENLKLGFTIMTPDNLTVNSTDDGWEFIPSSGNGRLILTFQNRVPVTQVEGQNLSEEEKALLQYARIEAEKTLRKIEPKQLPAKSAP